MTTTNGYGSMESRQGQQPITQRRRATSTSSTLDVPLIAAPRTNDTFYVGILLLLLVVVLWTASNFLTNYQLTSGYDKPFAVTYLNTSSFTLYLAPFVFVLRRKNGRSARGKLPESWTKAGFQLPPGSILSSSTTNKYPHSYAHLSTADEDREASNRPARRRERLQDDLRTLIRPSSIDGRRPVSVLEGENGTVTALHPQQAPLDLHQTAVLAAQFTIVWFLANYCLNVSLKLTSVASASTLSSASGFFTLALGAAFGVEVFTLPKLCAVTMSFIGVLMVTGGDSTDPSQNDPDDTLASSPLFGDLLALASALFYAVYVTLLKRKIGREDRVSMPLFFGFVGAFNVLAMWPIGLALHLTGLETIQLPQGRLMWAGVLVNMAITVVSDFAYLLAMLKSSPLVATVGLSLTIPLAILGDLLLETHSGGVQAYVGSSIVLVSFVVIGFADRKAANEQQHSQDAAAQTLD